MADNNRDEFNTVFPVDSIPQDNGNYPNYASLAHLSDGLSEAMDTYDDKYNEYTTQLNDVDTSGKYQKEQKGDVGDGVDISVSQAVIRSPTIQTNRLVKIRHQNSVINTHQGELHYGSGRWFVDKMFSRRLNRLLAMEMKTQYLLACLSTLGGAYHLCNHPRIALHIAKRQESLGRQLGLTSVIFKALVFQGVNYELLNKSKKASMIFQLCERMVKEDYKNSVKSSFASQSSEDLSLEINDNGMMRFLHASKQWLKNRDLEKESQNNSYNQTINEDESVDKSYHA